MRIIQNFKFQISNFKILGLGIIGVGLIAVLAFNQAGAQVVRPGQLVRFSYAAKFICGSQPQANVAVVHNSEGHEWAPQEPPVKKGNYATAVNIHNPQASRVKILKKVVIAEPEPEQGRPTEKIEHVLIPDGATEVDCREINHILAKNDQIDPQDNQFRKGFLVVESTAELDVVAVYTANTDAKSLTDPVGQAQGMTMDVEYIPARRILGIPNLAGPPIGIGEGQP